MAPSGSAEAQTQASRLAGARTDSGAADCGGTLLAYRWSVTGGRSVRIPAEKGPASFTMAGRTGKRSGQYGRSEGKEATPWGGQPESCDGSRLDLQVRVPVVSPGAASEPEPRKLIHKSDSLRWGSG